ncbi:MAG: YraN family protein [Candidatus Eisenbacteria bacterium]
MRCEDDTPRPSRVEIGRQAEQLVARYLELRGYRILASNARTGPREIDLVAHRSGVVAIVEVRFRAREEFGAAEESVRARKRRDLLRAGRAWWLCHGRALGRLRFDLIAVRFTARGLRLRHYPSFFAPSG